jgi:hypothetical protein
MAFTGLEAELEGGKRTPLHTQPIAESLWLLSRQIRYRIESDDLELQSGDFVMVPPEIPHAFVVLSDHARAISIQPSCECEPFYFGASEPIEGSARETEFGRLAASAATNGGIENLGAPPFSGRRTAVHVHNPPAVGRGRCTHYQPKGMTACCHCEVSNAGDTL